MTKKENDSVFFFSVGSTYISSLIWNEILYAATLNCLRYKDSSV